jgi:hypothetical protein
MFPVKRIFSLVAAVLFAVLVITGCDTSDGDDLAAELSGTWKSAGGDQFLVDTSSSPKTFTYWYGAGQPDFTGSDSMDYKGEIVGDVAANPNLLRSQWGYIVIKVTNSGGYGPTVGKYFAVHWKNLTAASVEEAGPFKLGSIYNKGIDTAAAAKTEYTAENGYFGQFGTYTKQ